MRKIITKDYEEMSIRAANIIARKIIEKPESVLGLPTGRTPVGTYARLVEYYEDDLLDFSQVITFNLDEYYNLPRDHEESFNRFMEEKLFSKVNLKEERTNIPNGEADDSERECRRYENRIEEAGGIDLMVLGIGVNGHIGFNEPKARWESRTRLVDLAESTKEQNFDQLEAAPDKALTMGIKTIMQSDRILLLASGSKKKPVLKKIIHGPVDREWPGSILQLHPNFTAVIDSKAAPDTRN